MMHPLLNSFAVLLAVLDKVHEAEEVVESFDVKLDFASNESNDKFLEGI
jgi:hypothetical protein